MMKYIYYSCIKCKEKFNRLDEMEYHLGDVHKIYDNDTVDKSYLIHFLPHNKGDLV